MKKYYSLLLGASIVLILFSSCKNTTQVERSFYFWKSSEYELSQEEVDVLKETQTRKLYVKFFEVCPDDNFTAVPYAKSQFSIRRTMFVGEYTPYKSDSLVVKTIDSLKIIPTIFIRNSVFVDISKGALDTLADNIIFLTNKYHKSYYDLWQKEYEEIQIDCDWTEKTKDNYFYLLSKIKTLSKKTLSCTLRLYPYKYAEKTGVPPVDKVTLMCYNLISPQSSEQKNSILNNEELKAYLKGAPKYPLHIDIALPVFYWIQVFQNDQFTGLITPKDKVEFFKSIKQVKPLWYEVQKEMVYNDYFLRPGDLLKVEEVSEQTTLETIELLKEYIDFDEKTTVTLFHLDGDNLKNYKHETLVRFYTDFSK